MVWTGTPEMCALEETKWQGHFSRVCRQSKRTQEGIALIPVVHRGEHIRTRKPTIYNIYNIPGHCQNMIKISLGGRNRKALVDSGAQISCVNERFLTATSFRNYKAQ